MRSCTFALLWLGLTISATAEPAGVRVAVIGDSGSQNLAALVTAELSGVSDITLVERNDLAKVGDEIKLQELASNDSIALGKLVGADGLLFIDKLADGVRIRFTAVGLGYALLDDEVGSATDLSQCAKSIAHRVAGYTSKLRLDPAKAIPLSILNLRADYGTAQSLQVERSLTLLLESRLTAVPEYVVLERRHAWSLALDHSLDPAAKPLLRGAYLIDGSLTVSSRDNCRVSLRIRVQDGRESTLAVEGSTDHLPGLADQIVAGLQKTIGGTVPALQPASSEEANEYLREALWGWRSRAPSVALEAVESAELLGGNEADVVALRAQVLITLADQGLEDWFPFWLDKMPKLDDADLVRQTNFVLRAIDEAARYRDGKMESKTTFLKTVGPWEENAFQEQAIESNVADVASKILILLEREQSPRADELRHKLRLVTDYDPLNGKPGKAMSAKFNNTISRTLFADDWAQSLEEELAFYRLVCTDNEVVLPTSVISQPGERFCARFLSTPEARQKEFDGFVESLKSIPASRRTYSVLRTHSADPAVADGAYRDFLKELWGTRDALVLSNSFTPALEDYYDIDDRVAARNAAAGLPLLHYLLTADKPGSSSTLLLKMLWHPDFFPVAEIPALWAEFCGYRKKHTDAAWAKYGNPDQGFDMEMDQLAAPLIQKYPQICVDGIASAPKSDDPLAVTKFWNPWLLPDTPDDRFVIQSWDVSPDGVWVGGYFTDGALYHINLERLTSERIPLPGKQFPEQIKSVSDAFYITYHPDHAQPRQDLARYDRKTGSWENRPLPDLAYLKMFEASGDLYFFVTVKGPHEETALVRYDWNGGKWIELANNRRRPARNQYDDTEPLIDIGGIYTGPAHRPCVTLQEGTFYIQEKPSPWPPIFNDSYNSSVVTEGNRTLVMNFDGEATLLDADAPDPQYWVANPTPHIRHFNQPGQPNPPIPTPWSAQARWQIPSDKNSNWRFNSGFHGENLYIFNVSHATGQSELLCYIRGQQEPRHIPLSFHLDDKTRTALSSPHLQFFTWTPTKLEHPESSALDFDSSMSFHIVATNQGLCLVYMINGFWFLSYKDIETYLKSHSPIHEPAAKAVSGSSLNTTGDDDYDPGNPTSFR